MKIVIGITDTEASYDNYPLWIKGEDLSVEIKTLRPDNKSELRLCDGIVLSGGVDTHPRFYGSNNINYPNAPSEFNEVRDQFELDVFHYSCNNHIPLLAICRGMQLVNIALGGDMIQDIEAHGKNSHRRNGASDGIHEIKIEKGSLVYEIISSENGIVNSAHHQALGILSDDLLANAWSADGIIEGLEWKNKTGKNFLLGVQWHPERLGNIQPGNPLGKNIRETFLNAVRNKL